LVSTSALADARARVAEHGGTVGEQLVAAGLLADDALTEFYKQRLLVPQVNPNTLARLAASVIALLPTEMAIELRTVPVSLDVENNLTVAMSDPSNRHAVDEIAFLTGAYVVRAVATQMQIAWCLAHYYGYVTPLGQRLLQGSAPRAVAAAVRPGPRAPAIAGSARDTQRNVPIQDTAPPQADPLETQPTQPLLRGPLRDTPARNRQPAEAIEEPVDPTPRIKPVAARPRRAATPDWYGGATREPARSATPASTTAAARPRGNSGADEARAALPRAASIRPSLPDDEPPLEIEAGEPSAPVISIEADAPEEAPPPRPPKRKRPAEPDPPELFARAGEVTLKSGPVRSDPVDEPRVVIADDLEAPPTWVEPSVEVSGELAVVRDAADRPISTQTKVQVSDEVADGPSSAVIIHEHPAQTSEPVLLDRRRSIGPAPPDRAAPPNGGAEQRSIDRRPEAKPEPGAADEVVELATRKKAVPRPRMERRTALGVGVVPATARGLDDSVSGELGDLDPTRLDTPVAPAGDYAISDDYPAAPPGPIDDHETSPHLAPPSRLPGAHVPPPSGKVVLDHIRARAPDSDDDSGERDLVTAVMSAVELDQVVPGRVDDSGDDVWGRPGSTIPPPLLGAMPGSLEPASGMIPMPNLDSEPLIVSPPVAPEAARESAQAINPVRALEEATARVLDLIRALDRATDRDQVVVVMVEHLAATHQRAGFFAVRAGELSLFMVVPSQASISSMALRLDRPSTLQDVVGTRLPYRGPMHDETSRAFLTATLGASPSELLLVPVSVRERVVGVLFGEQRIRHTFDDQLALAARAAGAALERFLKDRRGR
jgi:hypothetical protein